MERVAELDISALSKRMLPRDAPGSGFTLTCKALFVYYSRDKTQVPGRSRPGAVQ